MLLAAPGRSVTRLGGNAGICTRHRQLSAVVLKHGAHKSRNQRAHRRPLAPNAAVALAASGSLPAASPASPLRDGEEWLGGATGFARLARYWRLLEVPGGLLAACTACTVLASATTLGVATVFGKVIDAIGTASSMSEVATAVAVLAAVYAVSSAALLGQTSLSTLIGARVAERLRAKTYSAALRARLEALAPVASGDLFARLTADVEAVQGAVAGLVGARGLRALLDVVGIGVLLCLLSPLLGAMLGGALPLLGALAAAMSGAIKRESAVAQAQGARAASIADETVAAITSVRLFGAEGRQAGRYADAAGAQHASGLRLTWLQAALDLANRATNTVTLMATLGVGAMLAAQGSISVGAAYAAFIYAFSLAFAVSSVSNIGGEVAKAMAAADRLAGFLQAAEPEQLSPPGGGIVLACVAGEVELQDVWFSYGAGAGGAGEEGAGAAAAAATAAAAAPGGDAGGEAGAGPRWALRGVSLKVAAGERVALVGPSGSGKSTLAALLLRLRDPQRGRLLLDGTPLTELDGDWLRRQVGLVPQDPSLMAGSIADNIAYGRPGATQEEVEAAAATASAASFIAALPDGYASRVGERGVSLSGGQRQRIILARALLAGSQVLVLDEATSALDGQSEAAVTAALASLTRGRTVVTIAHRLSSIQGADLVVVLEAGRVAEQGPPAQLLARPGGAFRRLVDRASRQQGMLDVGATLWDGASSLDEEAGGAAPGSAEGEAAHAVAAAGSAPLPAAVTAAA